MLRGELDGADRDYFFPLGANVLSNYALDRAETAQDLRMGCRRCIDRLSLQQEMIRPGDNAMRLILFVAFASTICAAHADQPFIEIAGVKITRGMDETSVRAAFPEVNCNEDTPKSCSVGNGIPPENDGEITFENGRVRSAVSNLPLPELPGEVLMLLYTTLERIANADRTCAQVQLFSTDSGLKAMAIGFQDKALWIQTHGPSEHREDMIKETLRPADRQGEVDWKGRCIYGS